MKYLIVVDMQNDFITGSLKNEMAEAIVPNVVKKVRNFDGVVVFTRDTHRSDYLTTQEGKNLPVAHCIYGTQGWQICEPLRSFAKNVVNKKTFGSVQLPNYLKRKFNITPDDEIELVGICTDICVISNAMILKAAFPETKVTVDASCCAGVTKEKHATALNAMQAVQITVNN